MSVTTLERMVNWVEENIKDSPTLEDMSSFVGYSPFYCSNKFHEYTGVTFKQYLAKTKLVSAKKEVIESTRKMGDIALEYGFSSQEAFTRAFVTEYGISPFRFRKEQEQKM